MSRQLRTYLFDREIKIIISTILKIEVLSSYKKEVFLDYFSSQPGLFTAHTIFYFMFKKTCFCSAEMKVMAELEKSGQLKKVLEGWIRCWGVVWRLFKKEGLSFFAEAVLLANKELQDCPEQCEGFCSLCPLSRDEVVRSVGSIALLYLYYENNLTLGEAQAKLYDLSIVLS